MQSTAQSALASVFGASETEPSYLTTFLSSPPSPPPPALAFSTTAIATLCALAVAKLPF